MLFDWIFFSGEKVKPTPRNGFSKVFNDMGVLIEEGLYVNHCKNALWKRYYDSGELKFHENYNMGMLHGKFLTFYQNGQLQTEGIYYYGCRQGSFKFYDLNGALERTESFDRDLSLSLA